MIGKVDLPNVQNYDALGFDMDFTVVRYKIPELLDLNYKCILNGLIKEHGYPKELEVSEKELKNNIYKMFFRCCYDVKNGLLLKMGTKNKILRAYRGFKRLKNKEIISIYGENPVQEHYLIQRSKDQYVVNFHDFFRVTLVPLIAQLVHLRDYGKNEFLQKKTYLDLYRDLQKEVKKTYDDTEENEATNDYKNKYNYEMFNNTEKYVRPVSKKLLNKFKLLREKGKKIFICSNNRIQMGIKVLETAIGKDYDQYFDFIIFKAQKAKFFLDPQYGQDFLNCTKDATVKLIDIEKKNYKGRDKVISYGNANLVEQYIAKDLDRDPKILFFGDTIVKDCAYVFEKEKNSCWDICFIFEEMTEIEDGYFGEEEHLPYWQYWGSALFDKDIYRGIDRTSLLEFAQDKSHRTFSHLESKECLEFFTIAQFNYCQYLVLLDIFQLILLRSKNQYQIFCWFLNYCQRVFIIQWHLKDLNLLILVLFPTFITNAFFEFFSYQFLKLFNMSSHVQLLIEALCNNQFYLPYVFFQLNVIFCFQGTIVINIHRNIRNKIQPQNYNQINNSKQLIIYPALKFFQFLKVPLIFQKQFQGHHVQSYDLHNSSSKLLRFERYIFHISNFLDIFIIENLTFLSIFTNHQSQISNLNLHEQNII